MIPQEVSVHVTVHRTACDASSIRDGQGLVEPRLTQAAMGRQQPTQSSQISSYHDTPSPTGLYWSGRGVPPVGPFFSVP